MNKMQFGLDKSRSCTDILCLLLFIIALVALFIVAGIAFVNGDIKRMLYPIDSEGNVCGANNKGGKNYKNEKYVMYYNFIKCLQMGSFITSSGCPTQKVCVKKCPKITEIMTPFNYKSFISSGYCVGVSANDSYSTCVKKCPEVIVQSTSVLRHCLPFVLFSSSNSTIPTGNGSSMAIDHLKKLANTQGVYVKTQKFLIRTISDIITTKYDIVVFFIISLVITLIFIAILRCLAGVVVGVGIIVIIGSLGFGSFYFIYRYKKLKGSGALPWPQETALSLDKLGDYYKLNLTIGCILLLLLVVFVLIVLGCWKKIRIAVSLIKETSKAMGYVWGVIVWSLFPILLLILATVFCISIVGYLETMGSKNYVDIKNTSIVNDIVTKVHSIPCNESESGVLGSTCRFVKYGDAKNLACYLIFVLFMWFWLVQIIDGLNICVISGAFSGYYWALNKPEDIPAMPVVKSFLVVMRYHFGSVAFGGLLIAIVKFLRMILEYLSEKLKDSTNRTVQIFMSIISCCFWCLEKFLKFITNNALIQMMSYGDNFCRSAKEAFSLIVRNIVGKFVADFFAKMIIIIFILCSTSLTVLLSYLWFIPTFTQIKNLHHSMGLDDRSLNFELVPIIVVGIVSFISSRSIFEIYRTGISTLFLCYLDDVDKNDGSEEKPFYMSKEMMKILGKDVSKSDD